MFIITHGRPDAVHTLKSLSKAGYTGKYYLVIDDEDKTGPQYHAQYGDKVLTFSKDLIAETLTVETTSQITGQAPMLATRVTDSRLTLAVGTSSSLTTITRPLRFDAIQKAATTGL